MTESDFAELDKFNCILIFDKENEEKEKLENACIEEPILVDVGISDVLKNAIIKEYKIERLPAILYNKIPIYSSENIEEIFEEINLKKLKNFVVEFIKKAEIAVFMKGTLEKPYCKFSKQLIALFQQHNFTDIIAFDIFTDDQMREDLKKINRWNTYPMVYVKGKFIGGLDSFKEFIKE